MKLYAINDQRKLIGKEIIDIMVLGSGQIGAYVVTADGGIYVASITITNDEEEEFFVDTWSESEIAESLLYNKSLKYRLLMTKKITESDIDEFTANAKKKIQEEIKAQKKRKEEQERKLYEKLKQKYEEDAK